MRGFFWIIIAIYVFLYFYAVWLYDEFSIWMALAIIVAIGTQIYFVRKRKEVLGDEVAQPVRVETKPMSIWQSPFPYIGVAFCTYIGILIIL